MKKIIAAIIAVSVFLYPINVKSISAKAYILINADTGAIIDGDNIDLKLPMASTTKIMTAYLLALQNTPNKTVKVTKEMVTVEGSSMGLLEGDQVSYHDLLYGMLLASGNDAANVTAYILAGSPAKFADMMNAKALELGLSNTHFVTPSGLDDEKHYTTCRDLALLARIAMQNVDFYKAASSKSAVLKYGNPPYRRTLTNHNKLLNAFDGAVGVKTGFTKKSGRCLVSAAKRQGRYVIAVTLNDTDDWNDHTELLNYGLNHLYNYEIDLSKIDKSIPIIGGECDRVGLEIPSFKLSLYKGEKDLLSYEYKVKRFSYAPVKKGTQVGEIIYYYKKDVLAKYPVTVSNDVNIDDSSFLSKFFSCLKLILI